MNTFETTILNASEQQRQAIVTLLQTEKLPGDDLPASLNNFFVAVDGNRIIGAIGLEPYGNSGLLRSMVVNASYRNLKIASHLVQQLEDHAAGIGIDRIYLLTETAPGYFQRKGYQQITREEVPQELQSSSEFTHVCPVSAIVMKKSFRYANNNSTRKSKTGNNE